MKTAVEELVEDLIASGYLNYEEMPKGLIFRAKQMEKEQIETAYYYGADEFYPVIDTDKIVKSEQYYNETYGKDE